MNDQASSLVDRYIYAIRRLLPRAQRDDIAAELREAIESQVDGEESRAGRSLHGEEIAAILKRFGQPREVAARYGSQQYLIGPDVFPSYVVAVKVVLWVMVPVALFLVLLSIVTAEDHLFERLLDTLWTVLSIGLVNLSIVTLMFVYFGRASSGNLNRCRLGSGRPSRSACRSERAVAEIGDHWIARRIRPDALLVARAQRGIAAVVRMGSSPDRLDAGLG